MADITMCENLNNCPKANQCYRFLAKVTPQYQSYSLFECSESNQWEYFWQV